ncbi:hypothetical protein K435DRAFT_862124 [Dendrothele bispora CBS 962.96]|uniref:Uncharacterized protein n=1 Tax=Dendrothele bispora (strain CBS 962.96) TaxID=1314807 RepID=A0A4S8LTD6_DENBC|nr:hypothetical protein K435DRAFT_862124 [Dendrothele bispora CBS 962.96]
MTLELDALSVVSNTVSLDLCNPPLESTHFRALTISYTKYFSEMTKLVAVPQVQATGTNSASSAGATPVLFFSISGTTFTTCTSADISWNFAGPVENITLTVTNVNITQQAAPSPSSSAFFTSGTTTLTSIDQSQGSGSVSDFNVDDGSLHHLRRRLRLTSQKRGVLGIPTEIATSMLFDIPGDDSSNPDSPPRLLSTLSTSINLTSEVYTWDQVYVPQGWYQLIATASNPITAEYTNFVAHSASFFVSNGSDTSCLITSIAHTPFARCFLAGLIALITLMAISLLILWRQLKRKKPSISSTAAVLESQGRDSYHLDVTSPAGTDNDRDGPGPQSGLFVNIEAATSERLPESSVQRDSESIFSTSLTTNPCFLQSIQSIPSTIKKHFNASCCKY